MKLICLRTSFRSLSRLQIALSVGAAILVFAAMAPRPAWSQSEEESSAESSEKPSSIDDLPKDQKKRLLELIKSARENYSNGNFKDVVPKMKKAYGIFPDPEFLFRIGLSHERSNSPKKALKFYQRYLEEKPESEKRGRVEKTIASLEKQVKKSESKKKAKSAETDEEATGGETKTADSAQPEPEPTDTSESSGSNTFSIVMLTTGGLMTAATATFAVMNLRARSNVRDIYSERNSTRRRNTSFDSEVQKQNFTAGLAYICGALAAGALTTGFVTLSSGSGSETASSDSSRNRSPDIRVGFGLRGISVHGSF